LGDPVSDPGALGTIEDFQSSELHRNHLIQTLQSLQYIKTLPPANRSDLKTRSVKFPAFKHAHIKKTIIFDLDETLVHCIDDIERNPCDKEISVTFPNGETVHAGINIRPYAIECLRKANESYQVVIFTASHRAYADVVLDILDPTGDLI
jgi:CTD small phosphatase-like protein 2